MNRFIGVAIIVALLCGIASYSCADDYDIV